MEVSFKCPCFAFGLSLAQLVEGQALLSTAVVERSRADRIADTDVLRLGSGSQLVAAMTGVLLKPTYRIMSVFHSK